MPSGTLNPELTGNLPQFDHVAGYQGLLVLSGGQYSLTEKDGTKTSFIKSGDVYRPSVLTDRNGGTLSYAYNASGKLTGITDVHSRSISITYNAAGKPATVADFTNRTASFEYDVSGNPTKATDLDGSQTVYAYDGSGRMTDINYPNGAHKTMTYDNKNRVLTIAEDGGNNAQTGSDVTDCLRDILARYEASPFIIKSDRAKVFLCSQWLGLLSVNGITPHKIRPHCPQDQGIIERGMREVKTWLRANNPVSEEFPVCLDEGMFMLNFLKPKMVLNAATPAAVYLGNKMSAVCDKSKREVLCIAS
ncbi:MAG: DDE-type integrase/transposase/recombinase [Elusimicrobia bacterium]|nr:DDE-type integrase/transposase/recombinase [Elusimicrobiota bacterium]